MEAGETTPVAHPRRPSHRGAPTQSLPTKRLAGPATSARGVWREVWHGVSHWEGGTRPPSPPLAPTNNGSLVTPAATGALQGDGKKERDGRARSLLHKRQTPPADKGARARAGHTKFYCRR